MNLGRKATRKFCQKPMKKYKDDHVLNVDMETN